MSGNEVEDRQGRRFGATAARGRGRRRARQVEVATLWVTAIGVLVAIGAWLLPAGDESGEDAGGGSGGGSASSSAGPTATSTGEPSSSTPAPAPTGGPAGPDRYLTELVPAIGGSYVQRVGAHSLVMACGTGESDDRDREVGYDVPPAGYRSLRAVARPTGLRETRAKITVLVNGVVATAPVLTAGSSGELAAPLDGPGRLTVRITCDPGAKSVTFTDPGLYR